jgi:TP901 family phage tail tape measure protein
MAQEKAIVLNIEGSDATLREIGLVEQGLAEVNKELARMRKAGEQTSQEFANMTLKQQKLRGESANLRKELRNQVKDFEVLEKELPIDSTVALERQWRKLREEWRKMSAEAKRSDAGKALEAQANSIKNQINISNKAIGDYTTNIGRYEEAIQGLEAQQAKLIRQLETMDDAAKASDLGETLQREAKLVDGAIKDMRADMKALADEQGKLSNQFGKFAGNTAAYAKQALIFFGVQDIMFRAIAVGREAVKTIFDFEEGLAKVSSITGVTGKGLDFIADQALKMSGAFGTSATEMLRVFQLVGSALPELLKDTKLLTQVAQNADILAKASGDTVEQSVEVIKLAIAAFDVDVNRTSDIIDILATAAQKGAAEVPQISEALKNVGSVAKLAGLDLETTVATIEALAAGGVNGAEAGTALRNILATIAKTGREDLNPALTPLPDILDTLSEELKTLPDAIALFKRENAAAALTLIQQRDVLRELLGNGGLLDYGNAMSQAATNTDTARGTIQKFNAAWDNLVVSVERKHGAIGELLGQVAEIMTDLLNLASGNIDVNRKKAFGDILYDKLRNGPFSNIGTANEIADKYRKEAADNLKKFNQNYELVDNGFGFFDIVKKGSQPDEPLLVKYKNIMDLIGQEADANTTASLKQLKDRVKDIKKKLQDETDKDEILKLVKELNAAQLELKEVTDKLKLDATDHFAKGSIGFIDKQITDLNDKLQRSTSSAVRESLTRTIAGLEEQKTKIEEKLEEIRKSIRASELGTDSIEGIQFTLGILGEKLNKAEDAQTRAAIQQEIAALELRMDNINKELQRVENKAKPGLSLKDQFGFKLTARNPFEEKKNEVRNLFGETAEEEAKRIALETETAEKNRQETLDKNQAFLDANLEQQKAHNQAYADAIGELGDILVDLFTGSEENQKNALKRFLLLTVKLAEKQLEIAALASNTKALIEAGTDPILLAKAALDFAIRTALIKGAGALLRGLIQGFESGGVVKDSREIKGGVAFKREGSSDTVLVHAKPGEVILNKNQQAQAERLYGSGVWGDIGMKGFKTSQSATNNIIKTAGLGGGTVNLSESDINVLADTMADRVEDAIVNSNRILERKRIKRALNRRHK